MVAARFLIRQQALPLQDRAGRRFQTIIFQLEEYHRRWQRSLPRFPHQLVEELPAISWVLARDRITKTVSIRGSTIMRRENFAYSDASASTTSRFPERVL